jgi:hypothetical protein
MMRIGGVAFFVALIAGCALLAVNVRKNTSLDRLLGDLSYPVYVGQSLATIAGVRQCVRPYIATCIY